MKALVSYDDSDSEDTLVIEEPFTGSLLECETTEQNLVSNSTRPNYDLPYYTDKTEPHTAASGPYRHLASAHWHPNKPTSERIQGAVCPSLLPVAGTASMNAKRSTPAGLKPYVSKRQRITTPAASPQVNEESLLELQATSSRRLFSEVSERVRPFLERKRGRTELPRFVQHHLQAHEGPVNTVQWCPVPPLSHLLLSASMDKTFKVWDGAGSGRCLQTYSTHCEAVRDACWLPCGRRVFTGSFDNTAAMTDVETGQVIIKMENQFKVTCLAIQPMDPSVVLCGGFSDEVKAWDSRICKTIKVYRAGIQQTLDILFLREGKELVTSSDAVSRDSADRTLIAWDFTTTAKISNQIFHERYTCPSLALHPQDDCFVAQTNGNYIALFSTQKPYKMNKRKRFEGHKVEGYAVQCELSSDGGVLATGSSVGSVHFYDFHTARRIRTLHAHPQACVSASFHPVLPAAIATCDWGGEIKIWN
ncbi:WD repeat-containing protein 25 [Brachyhypopomus gauderio]|uniref:WD repeat-containing protein 25 n=1 Tax=Brachyhypopomus gauderio TaxID=698409 RepID=UPI0040429682